MKKKKYGAKYLFYLYAEDANDLITAINHDVNEKLTTYKKEAKRLNVCPTTLRRFLNGITNPDRI